MKQEVNIYAIAKEAGVSIATVSRVVNNTGSVSDRSRKRVLDAVNKMNYVPSNAAKALSTSTSNLISVVIPDIENPFFSLVLQGVTRVADKSGLNIFLFNTDENSEREHRVLQSMREHRLRGIIITPVSCRDKVTLQKLQDFEALGIPVVLLDRELDDADLDRVVANDEEGVYHAVTEMIRIGHRKIAIIAGPDDSRPGRERYSGYCRAMREHGLEIRPEYVRMGDFKVQRAYEETLILCRMEDAPTAIFSSNNMTTYGCLKAFAELGIRTGRDIALVGFDEIEALGWLNYSISVVNRDVQQMGEQAMRLLLRRFESGTEEQTGARVCLSTELVLRGSEKLPGRKV